MRTMIALLVLGTVAACTGGSDVHDAGMDVAAIDAPTPLSHAESALVGRWEFPRGWTEHTSLLFVLTLRSDQSSDIAVTTLSHACGPAYVATATRHWAVDSSNSLVFSAAPACNIVSVIGCDDPESPGCISADSETFSYTLSANSLMLGTYGVSEGGTYTRGDAGM